MAGSAVHLEMLKALPLKEQVLQQLRRLIEDGHLSPGDQLPPERELAERLGVSRGTVREAVQFLHALGVVEIRHGSGTFVRALPEDDAVTLSEEWRRWTARHSDTVRALLEIRMGLESFAAQLAAERGTPDQLESMADALERMGEATSSNDVTALVRADVVFHQELCQASGNRALADLAHDLGSRLVPERAATWGLPGRPEQSLRQHRRIFEAIRRHDGAGARRAVLDHLRSVQTDVDTHMKGEPT
jgi:DNA-binding FadR family transcriptional regulator